MSRQVEGNRQAPVADQARVNAALQDSRAVRHPDAVEEFDEALQVAASWGVENPWAVTLRIALLSRCCQVVQPAFPHRSTAGNIAPMAVGVDAKDEAAAAFYRHFNFLPQQQPRRLFLPMKTIATLFG